MRLWQQLAKESSQGCLPCPIRIPCQLTLASPVLLSAAISEWCNFFFSFSDLVLDGAVWNKNTEAFPVSRWPLSAAQSLRQDTERRLACGVVCVSFCYQSHSESNRGCPPSHPLLQGKAVYWGDWQKIQKRRKCGKIATGLIMEGGMWEIDMNQEEKQG